MIYTIDDEVQRRNDMENFAAQRNPNYKRVVHTREEVVTEIRELETVFGISLTFSEAKWIKSHWLSVYNNPTKFLNLIDIVKLDMAEHRTEI